MTSLRYLAVIAVSSVLLAIGLSRAPAPPQSFLGLEFAPLTRAAQSRTPMLASRGALVAYVYPLGPADVAGIKPGEVVAAIDGKRVETAEHAAGLVDAAKAGDRIVLTVIDIAAVDPHPRKYELIVAAGRPLNEKVYTVRAPRTLAREWDFGPGMAANAAWSRRIARGAVDPFPLLLYARGRCSALAPKGWLVADAVPDASRFALMSAGHHVKAIYRVAALAKDQARDPLAFTAHAIEQIFGSPPQMGMPRAQPDGFFVVDWGTLNNYAGFVLYRVDTSGAAGPSVSLRIAGVPATEVEGLRPLAGAVALSIRCEGNAVVMSGERRGDLPPTSVSARCAAADNCDESDLAGAYNEVLHTGYVHSPDGDNFLIDPRKDIWAMGPAGSGTYRQNGGALEKLEPGRTN